MELETHQVREEANHKQLVSQFPHFPSWPPPDDNMMLGPTWRLCTPPTLTNACHFKHKPTVFGVSPSFWMWPHCLKHETVISNTSPLFRTWARHFTHEPVILNVSPSFHMQAHRFEREPVISHANPSFWRWACHFACEPVVSNMSPSFWLWACHFECDPWTTATSLTMTVNATKSWSAGHIISRHNVQGVFISILSQKCNYFIYYHVQDWSGTGCELVLQLQKTAWNCCGLVYDSFSLSFREFEKVRTGLSPSLVKYGQKTGLDRTSKHYPPWALVHPSTPNCATTTYACINRHRSKNNAPIPHELVTTNVFGSSNSEYIIIITYLCTSVIP